MYRVRISLTGIARLYRIQRCFFFTFKQDKMPLDNDPTAADAEWKKIQQRTFTRWCNEHLKVANIVIYDLETDLCDGIKLIVLLEVLSHKRVGKYNKKPKVKSQKLENVAIALKFIESENIKVVNIGKCTFAYVRTSLTRQLRSV